MAKGASNIPRGRKPKQFSRLSQFFRTKTTRELCKAKPFADDKSRCFVRYLLKNFKNEMVFIIRDLGNLEVKMTSNQKADFAISLVQKSGSLIAQIRKKFTAISDWQSHLERLLKIEYVGDGSRTETLEKLLDCICQYIGPKNQDSDEETLEEIDNREDYHRTLSLPVQVTQCMLDEIDPGSYFERELENNRENPFTSGFPAVNDYSLENPFIWSNDFNTLDFSPMQEENPEDSCRKSTDCFSNSNS